MNDVQLFSDKLFGNVRGYMDGDMPWLCLADVCKALGIENNRDTISRLNRPGVGKVDIGVKTGIKADGNPAVQIVKMTFINEPNLYRLILRSNKPQAEKFIDWVTCEVLPILRKTGAYIDHGFKGADRRIEDYTDPLTKAIAKEVWAAVDKVYLKWIQRAKAQEALEEFKRIVGRS